MKFPLSSALDEDRIRCGGKARKALSKRLLGKDGKDIWSLCFGVAFLIIVKVHVIFGNQRRRFKKKPLRKR